MSKFDGFFEAPVDPNLDRQILKNAQVELEINRSSAINKRWFVFLAPLLATLAAVVVFRLTSDREAMYFADNSEQVELASDLLDNEDVVEIAEDLMLLEELEYIEQIEVDDV